MSKRMAIYSRVSTERQTVANQASEGGDSIFLVLVSVSERYLHHWLISPINHPMIKASNGGCGRPATTEN